MLATPLLLAALLAPQSAGVSPGPDWIVPSGTTVVYDTTLGPLRLKSLDIQPGGILRIVGPNPFRARVLGTARINGTLDASAWNAFDVGTIGTGAWPALGSPGHAGSGRGGVGSWETTTSTPAGGDGFGPFDVPGAPSGGKGGETAYALGPKDWRRPGGGGGGALGPDVPGGGPGFVARPGADGHPNGTGAISGLKPAAGGAAGASVFVDGDPTNDFWGLKPMPGTPLAFVHGELAAPVPGSGGGAGGDAVPSPTFPSSPWTPTSDEKGAGGGGGGGLVMLQAGHLVIGPQGSVIANGGNGANGENTIFLDHIGGSSGGGSGGYLVLMARIADLSKANPSCLSARGGLGGVGGSWSYSNGGDGGPGVIQVHTPPGQLLLPAGVTLEQLSVPDAHLLLPQPLP